MPQSCSRSLPGNFGTTGGNGLCEFPRTAGQDGGGGAFRSALVQSPTSKTVSLSREQQIRHAVLLGLCGNSSERHFELRSLSPADWQRLLHWLDIGGLALSFLDQMAALELNHLLPTHVLERLRQNLRDNTKRTRGMIAESIGIQRGFRDADVRYAVLKGLSLWPNSVRKPELRSQFDLDFLVAEEDLPEARKILARRGYRLYGQNGRSWEFKRNERPGITVKDLYKHLESWVVELHADPDASSHASIFTRLQWREIAGFSMPVLPPVDLFLRQCLHAYKHIRSEFLRAAILIEFRRHVLFRTNDCAFWDELHSAAHQDRHACLALGVVTSLISRVMGDFAPEALTSWTVAPLPQNVKLWVELYGYRAVLGSFPGTKLYLLMPCAVEAAGGSPGRDIQRKLLPLCFPPPAIRAVPNEPMPRRIRRYRMQFGIIVSRLRFHVVEGLRFAYERWHWRQHLKEIAS